MRANGVILKFACKSILLLSCVLFLRISRVNSVELGGLPHACYTLPAMAV
jgi:hypothetical protein